MQWKLPQTFLILSFIFFNSQALATSESLTLMQDTSTDNVVNLVCDNGQFMSVQGNSIQVYEFASVRDYANGTSRLTCTLTVVGKDKSLSAIEADGGTLAINIDTTNQKINISDIKFNNPVTGLFWLDRANQVSPATGEFTLNNTTIMLKDNTF